MTLVCADKEACDERFSLVYEMTYNEIRKYASCRCGDPQHLPDLLQEIYLEYYRTLRRKGCAYVRDDRALLMKIASRCAMRYYTLKQRMRLLVPIQAAGENVSVTDTDFLRQELKPDPQKWGVKNSYRVFYSPIFIPALTSAELSVTIGCTEKY